MKACTDYQGLIIDHASGDLDAPGREALDGHLWRCPACQAELAATREALGLAALPPMTARDLSMMDGLSARVRTGLRLAEHRRVWLRGVLAGAVAAAAVALFFLVPRSTPAPRPPRVEAPELGPAAAELEAWGLSDPLAEILAEEPLPVASAESAEAALDPLTHVDLYLNPGE
jgi:anti-sigma factor RsiW